MSELRMWEKWESRRYTGGENPTLETVWIVEGSNDPLQVDALLKAGTAEYATMESGRMARQTWEAERKAQYTWEARVHYAKKQTENQTGQSSYHFETSGGTSKITQSIATVGRYVASGTPPDFKGAIGVTKDSVEGVDITSPTFSFSETHYLPAEMVTEAYKTALFYMTGKVNSVAFRGKAPGEVLFLGASGDKRGEEDWEINYRFMASPNLYNITVGDITGINKAGWDYMWIYYEDSDDTAAKMLVKRPKAVIVERVYYFDNFLSVIP